MAFLFGVAMLAPEDVMEKLQKASIVSVSDIGVVSPNHRLGEVAPSAALFFLNMKDYQRNINVLNTENYNATLCFLFASPTDLLCAKAELLDVDGETLNPLSKPNFGKIVKIVRRNKPQPLRIEKIDFISRLVDDARNGSLLNPLMTFIYSLKSQQQGYVKLLCAKWLSRNVPIETLQQKLQNYEYPISANKFGQLASILLSEEAASFRKAFQDIRAGKSVSEVCAQHHVPEYEVNYLTSVLATSGKKDARTKRKAQSGRR